MQAIKEKLKAVLSQRQTRRVVDASRVPSAVLVPIYCKEGEPYILLTQRTETVKDHKGQISFPGGAYELKDGTLLNTALRECAEEIGLPAEEVELLGTLDDTITYTSRYVISPFVAAIAYPYPFKADEREIKELIEVPVSALLDRSYVRPETRVIDGQAVTVYSYHYRGKKIWGATARILDQLLDIFARVMKEPEEPKPG